MRAEVSGPVPLPERASDDDRDRAIAELRERSAAGEISHDTFVHRMEIALRARSRPELAGLLADLPPGRFGRRLVDAVERFSTFSARLGQAWRMPRLPRLTLPRPTLPPDRSADGASPVFTIGREPDCDLVIPDLTVSRRHAHLTLQGGHWLLADLGSMNGTRCNGWRINSPVRVHSGDKLTFGSVSFIVAG
ncbi:MAG: FHA domain-containing protein [Micromonosporaceae bacterium]